MNLEKFMDNLIQEIRNEMNKRNCSMSDFSFLCKISYECLCDIIYKRTKNPKISTIINICENSGISYSKIFEIQNVELFEQVLRTCYITNGDKEYKIL